MKNIIVIMVIGLFAITGCTSVKTVTKELENQSFIELIGNPDNYLGGVNVTIDDKSTFKAEVNQIGIKRSDSTIYAISTGKHIVKVKYNNNIIYTKQIFVSAQETKQIILP